MACAPHTCDNHNLGTSGCISHRPGCPTNRVYSGSANFGVPGRSVTAGDIELLRSNIMAEIDAFNAWQSANGRALYSKSDPGGISAGAIIDNSHINRLSSTLSNINSPGVNVADGSIVYAYSWNSILASYNIVRQDCICNSDCSCNTVCACHGNCGCNY